MSYEQQYRPSGFKLLPPVVKNILIINGIMYLATLAFYKKFGIELHDILGLHYPTSPKFHWYQIFTYMFIHDRENPSHILFNMFGVWMFGYTLENYWGARRFIVFYLVTAFGAVIAQTLFNYWEIHSLQAYLANPNPDDFISIAKHYYPDITELVGPPQNYVKQVIYELTVNSTCFGASGALFGILIAFGMIFPNTELIMIFFPVPIKAKYFVMIYAGIELFSGFSRMAGDNVAHFAHLGGALFGFVLIRIWQRNRQHFY
ncbi:MAG TPA: rhomboid family intramembrane serine protease [Bacteroidia bacterium]|nr:rhomboid family intramembrane serine protease [Bacteroidia bacterium]